VGVYTWYWMDTALPAAWSDVRDPPVLFIVTHVVQTVLHTVCAGKQFTGYLCRTESTVGLQAVCRVTTGVRAALPAWIRQLELPELAQTAPMWYFCTRTVAVPYRFAVLRLAVYSPHRHTGHVTWHGMPTVQAGRPSASHSSNNCHVEPVTLHHSIT